MTNGLLLTLLLVGGLIVWGILDALHWFAGQETMSQWVIEMSKKYTWFKWVVRGVVVGIALVLLVHWELI